MFTNDINRTHNRALESTLEELLDKGKSKTIHQKNLQIHMAEIYKTINHLNPAYMWEFFIKKDVPHNLRSNELCKIPSGIKPSSPPHSDPWVLRPKV